MSTGAIRNGAILAVLVSAVWLLGPAAGRAEPQCRCRYAGDSYLQGQCVCMTISGQQRYACCGRVLNNASWSFSETGCPVAGAHQAVESEAAEAASARFDRPLRGSESQS